MDNQFEQLIDCDRVVVVDVNAGEKSDRVYASLEQALEILQKTLVNDKKKSITTLPLDKKKTGWKKC